MTELSPEALALLEAARSSHGPTPHERERVLGSLYASLGIAVPLALTASAAEAANLAASAQSATAVQSAGQAVVQSTGQAMLNQAGAATATKGGVWGFGAKLLTWNAGKVFLATLALGSAVGVGVQQLPTKVDDQNTDARSIRASAKGRATVLPASSAAALGTAQRADAPAAQPQASERSEDSAPAAGRTSITRTSGRLEPVVTSAAPITAPAAPPAIGTSEAALGNSEAAAPVPSVEPARVPAISNPRVALPVDSESASEATATKSGLRSQRVATSHRSASAHAHRRRVRASSNESSALGKLAAAPLATPKPVAAPETPSSAASSATAAAEAPAATPAATRAVAVDAAPSTEPTLATTQATGELALIRQALTSLRDRDASGAVALLDQHAARYPNGAFATERRGLHVVALCASGNLRDGRAEQAEFLRQAGSSPIAPRVRRACAEPKK